MPANTPKFALPYPLGTDRVMDGDDAIKALAERIEAIIGTSRSAWVGKTTPVTGFKPAPGWVAVAAQQATLNMTAAGIVLLKAESDISNLNGTGFTSMRIGTDEASQTNWYDVGAPVTRAALIVNALMYVPAGATVFQTQVTSFQNNAAGLSVNSTRWMVHAFGGTPSFT